MNFKQRQQSYKAAVAARPELAGAKAKTSDAFGVSNSAKFVEDGLFAFNANFEKFPPAAELLLVHCLVRFPPEDEIYFSILVRSGIAAFRQRLDEMRASGSAMSFAKKKLKELPAAEPSLLSSMTQEQAHEDEEEEEEEDERDGPSSTGNNKNVKGYIAKDGGLYLRNKSYWDILPPDLSSTVKPVQVDAIYFSIWPPAISARRSLLAQEFVGDIGASVGREKVHELRVWTDDTQSLGPEMQRMPSTIPVEVIEEAVRLSGGHYPAGEVGRLHAALNFLERKHFVILSGLSGTGKTQLAIRYARAVHGLAGPDRKDPFLVVCPVRPEWTDPSGLTGYFDVLSNRYVVPPFLEAVLLATAHRRSPVFVVLDELNLARVEYYFSDVLSCLETGEPLRLHSSGVPLEGSTGISIPAELPLPPNLYFVGTINVDETTNRVSDKVLDRAMSIDMSSVDLEGFLAQLGAIDSLAESSAACAPQLVEVHRLMSAHGLGFGYRVAEEVVRYHAFASQRMPGTVGTIMDDLLVQKVFVKLRGSERQLPLLTGLHKAIAGLKRSQEVLDRLMAEQAEFGSFQASR